MTRLSGRFWRAITADHLDCVTDGARHPEGRFHHDGQPALYLSPRPEFARLAIAAYVRADDPARLVVPLLVGTVDLLDLREPTVHAALGLKGTEASTPWQPERAAGHPATSWIASDAARSAGANGIIYGARSDASRWHVVLFRWNATGGPSVQRDGEALPFAA